jgi:hypothetical protein
VDRGFDQDAVDPFCGSGAHAVRGHAPTDLPEARLTDRPSGPAGAVPTRPWSRHALRALVTAWVAIASSNLSEAPGSGSEHSAADLEGAAS